jgi:hypothetical protein
MVWLMKSFSQETSDELMKPLLCCCRPEGITLGVKLCESAVKVLLLLVRSVGEHSWDDVQIPVILYATRHEYGWLIFGFMLIGTA